MRFNLFNRENIPAKRIACLDLTQVGRVTSSPSVGRGNLQEEASSKDKPGSCSRSIRVDSIKHHPALAAGTGGFPIAAHRAILRKTDAMLDQFRDPDARQRRR